MGEDHKSMGEEKKSSVGWLAVLTALIPLFGILYNNHVTRAENEANREIQVKTEEEKAYRTNEAAYLSTVIAQEDREKRIALHDNNDSWKVSFRNYCADTANVAVLYESTTGDRVVVGWYPVNAGSTVYVFTTTSANFGYWAHSDHYDWDGKNDNNDSHLLRTQRFRYILDYHFDNGWYKPKDAFYRTFREADLAEHAKGAVVVPLVCLKR